jgi:predicted 3-demethylubiquinone-9 3-methyltransferase (glyoxalase superfamily)
MTSIAPCLWFDTQALEAATFYCSVIPDSRILSSIPYPEGSPGPAGEVMLVNLVLAGTPVQALNGGPQFSFTEAISMAVTVDTQEEVDHLWAALTADGGEPGPCGWLRDRYGSSWQVTPAGLEEALAPDDPERAWRAMQALLGMTKIDLAVLRAAIEG